MSGARRVLVLGIGNPDRGDDGVGAFVVHRLRDRLAPGCEVRTCAGDIVGIVDDCAGFEAWVCVDCAAPAAAPGHVHRIDLAVQELPRELLLPASSHTLGITTAIELARALGNAPADIVFYAVEGCRFDLGAGLSPAVAAAATRLVEQVAQEVQGLRQRSADPR